MPAPWEKYRPQAPTAGPWAKYAAPEPSAPAPEQPQGFAQMLGSAGDAGRRYVSEFASGIGDAATNWAKSFSLNPLENARNTVEGVANLAAGALQQPINLISPDPNNPLVKVPTFRGQNPITDVVGAVSKPVGDIIGGVSRGVGSVTGINPARVEAGINTLAMAQPLMRGRSATADVIAPAKNITEVARAAQYKLRPSDVAKIDPEASVGVGKKLEKFAMSNDLRKDFIEPNQRTTNRLIGEGIGIPRGTKTVTPELLEEVGKPHRMVYGEVGMRAGKFSPSEELSTDFNSIVTRPGLEPDIRAKISQQVDQYRAETMNGPDTIKTISALRRRGTKQLRSEDVSVNDQGYANRSIADALESELGRQLEAKGATKLLGKFRDARVQLAKIHDAEGALRAGSFDASVFRKLQDRGAPLSGNFKVVADVAEHFPWITKHPLTYADIGGAKNLGHETLYSEVKALPAAGLRKFLGSETYQNKLGRAAPPGQLQQAAPQYFQQRIPKQRSAPAPAPAQSAPQGPRIVPGSKPGYFAIQTSAEKPFMQVQGREAAEQILRELPSNVTPIRHNVDIKADADSGEVIAKSANGETLAQESGKYLQFKRNDTAPNAQKTGEGIARYRQLAVEAEKRGLLPASDFSLSPAEVKLWDSLKRSGWKIKTNAATINKNTGNLVSVDPRVPVFEVVKVAASR